MSSTRPLMIAAVAASIVWAARPAAAHHSFTAEFDRDQPVEVTGVVTLVEWTNPHARIYVDAPDPDHEGEVVNWNFELGTPALLMRQGWTRNSLKLGQTVKVNGWRARNAPHVANARTVTTADGKALFAGTSNQEAN